MFQDIIKVLDEQTWKLISLTLLTIVVNNCTPWNLQIPHILVLFQWWIENLSTSTSMHETLESFFDAESLFPCRVSSLGVPSPSLESPYSTLFFLIHYELLKPNYSQKKVAFPKNPSILYPTSTNPMVGALNPSFHTVHFIVLLFQLYTSTYHTPKYYVILEETGHLH